MANFNYNKTTLGGRIATNVEVKQTPSGVPVCSFTLAVTRKANRAETDFIKCVAWRNTAEFIGKFFEKGSSICVTGAIQTRTWKDQNGNNRSATEVIVEEADFVDSKSESEYPSFTKTEAEAPKYEEVKEDQNLPF